jgi:signal transduction histidine kinase
MRIHFLIFRILPFLFFGLKCFSQTPYLVGDTRVVHRLDAHTDIFIDDSNTMGIDEISSPEFSDNFQRSNGGLTFGYLKSDLWLRVPLKTTLLHKSWYLEIPAPFLEYVDFYLISNGQIKHSTSGYYRPHSVRTVSHTAHAIPLLFDADSSSLVYIKIAGSSPKTFPILILEREKFAEKIRFEDVGYGIFFGMLIVMFFYNLFIYFTLKQTNFILYVCVIACTFLIFSSASGYAGKFLWPDTPIMNFYAGRLSLGVLGVVLSVFTIRFLEVKLYSTTMYRLLLGMIPLSLLAIFLVATDILSSAGNNLISVATIVFMSTGIVCAVKGNKIGYYFIAAWTIYLIGGLLLTLRNSGVLPFNFWTTHFVEVGAALETSIIAFALGDRYRRYKIEKEEAQALALKIQQEATEELEQKVMERTEQLSKTNEELQSTLETNKLQTKIIEDKNAELDSFFHRISHDLKGPISSLLSLSFLAKIDLKDQHALDYFEKQHGQLERLNNIIVGLINLTKINQEDVQKEKIDFGKMINECISSFNGLPNFRNITFRKDIQPGIEFYSEWTLLNAILQNLIENAIKYSSDESPFVEVKVSIQENFIILEVSDNGEGIAEEHQTKIFEMFYRATQNATGTGLGLYILKRSVDRLKGAIEIKSKLGVGSTFSVKLPA